MKQNSEQQGIFYAILSFIIWGFLPLYWHHLDSVPAGQILAHRVIWAFVFMISLLLVSRKQKQFFSNVKQLFAEKRKFVALTVASFLVATNWGIYIWAVNNGHILETSLGYYINPLVSVLLGIIVLKERLTVIQYLSVALAFFGVLVISIESGGVPYVSLALAGTFSIYGLTKKMIPIDAAIGLAVESMMVLPIALLYLLTVDVNMGADWTQTVMLIAAGAATAIPLLFFAKGARLIPLSTLGFVQFVAPTMMLFIGVFVYGETFTMANLVSFTLIWIGLLIFSLSKTNLFARHSTKKSKQASA